MRIAVVIRSYLWLKTKHVLSILCWFSSLFCAHLQTPHLRPFIQPQNETNYSAKKIVGGQKVDKFDNRPMLNERAFPAVSCASKSFNWTIYHNLRSTSKPGKATGPIFETNSIVPFAANCVLLFNLVTFSHTDSEMSVLSWSIFHQTSTRLDWYRGLQNWHAPQKPIYYFERRGREKSTRNWVDNVTLTWQTEYSGDSPIYFRSMLFLMLQGTQNLPSDSSSFVTV